MKGYLPLLLLVAVCWKNVSTCPKECSCTYQRTKSSVNCYMKHLGFIPTDIPNNTVTLNLQYNDILGLDELVCQQSLKFLDLSHNTISEIPNEYFTDCQNLQTLNLGYNSIYRINPDAFPSQVSLKTLNVEYNKIRQIDVEVCSLFPSLETLDFSSNAITLIKSNAFVGCRRLSSLDLSSNAITLIQSNAFVGCRSLSSLNFYNNRLQSINSMAFQNLTGLVTLNLESNSLVKLDILSPRMFPNLQTLDLSSNQISQFGKTSFVDCHMLKSLDLDSNHISVVPSAITTECDNLQTLSLRNNLIHTIRKDTFNGCKSLKTLYLNGNELSEIQNMSFIDCQRMTSLSLSSNKLKKINQSSFGMSDNALSDLDLKSNEISVIQPFAFAKLTSLRTLSLSANNLKKIEQFAFNNLKALTNLDLESNELSMIDQYAFATLSSLGTLSFSSNKLNKIEQFAFNNLTALTNLDLESNEISIIDQFAFTTLTSLTTLSLRYNKLMKIGEFAFDNLTVLTNLDLESNDISAIHPAAFIDLQSLQTLDLHTNNLSKIHPVTFGNVSSLQTLDISNNKLINFELDGAVVPSLRYLDLRYNKIKTLDFNMCVQLPQLYTLHLSWNQIVNISEGFFNDCYSLVNLYLRNNRLISIDEYSFANNTHLQNLQIDANEISTIHPEAFRFLPSLQSLYLTGNPISNGGYDFVHFCGNLETLYMGNTRLNESHAFINADHLVVMSHLQTLHLENNMLTDLDPNILAKMPQLFELWMQNNKLTVLKSDTFQNKMNLYEINLDRNNISYIQENAFGELPRLYKLDMYNNPLVCDCSIFHFWKWLIHNYLHLHNSYSPRCSNGTSVESLNKNIMYDCDPTIPKIEAKLMETEVIEETSSLLPVFRCTTGHMRENSSTIYEVYWYLNDKLVTTKENVTFDNLDSSVLLPVDWIDTHKMNMKVKCAVRERNISTDVPGTAVPSEPFYAGLMPDKYEYTVLEGESAQISFTSTVPVGCYTSDKNERLLCTQNFNIFVPEGQVLCRNSVSNKDVIFEAQICGIQLTSVNWQQKQNITVYGYNDGLYNFKGRVTYIKIATDGELPVYNKIWEEIMIPDIKITVVDKDTLLANRLCQIHNDPHVRTFDGKVYDYMEVGEFVMYENRKGPYMVHVLFSTCGAGINGPSCICGVAVRSRNSLFVLRTCERISKRNLHMLHVPMIKEPKSSCDGNDMFVDHLKNGYKIKLPHGTEIKFTMFRFSRFISGISIKPSVYDLNDAKGLCGVPNTRKNTSDDFTRRHYGVTSDSQAFGDSWRITKAMTKEQLFIEKPAFLNSPIVNGGLLNENEPTTRRYCNCGRRASSSGNFHNVYCNLTTPVQYCLPDKEQNEIDNPERTPCNFADRQKRSVGAGVKRMRRSISDDDDVVENQPLSFDPDIFTKTESKETFRHGWTFQKAFDVCKKKLQDVLPEKLYKEHTELPFDYYVQSCVKDIELTANTSFLSDTVSAMTTFVFTEVVRKESLYHLHSPDGSGSLLQYITSQLCPNNCSQHGDCVSGVCTCMDGYTGDDCSQETKTPPSNIYIPFEGRCTLGNRACRRTNIYGDFPSTTIWSKLKHFQVMDDRTVYYTAKDKIVPAEYRNMYTVSVPLPPPRRKRSSSETVMADGFQIRLSNDGVNFGHYVSIIIYDDSCYSCNTTSMKCVDLGVCKQASPDKQSPGFNKALVALGTVSGFLLAIVIVIIVLGWIKNKNKNERMKVLDMYNDARPASQFLTISSLDVDVNQSFDKQSAPESHMKHFKIGRNQ